MSKISSKKGPRTVYRCSGCGHVEIRWLGRCPACAEFGTLIEELEHREPPRPGSALVSDGAAPIAATEVAELDARHRVSTGLAELDRVLGGGLVPGSVVLLGGEPGIGKSTLLLQLLGGVAFEVGPVAKQYFVDAPFACAGGDEQQEDEAEQDRAFAVVEHRERPARCVHHPIGDRHLAGEQQGHRAGEQTDQQHQTADQLKHPRDP